MSQAQLGSPHFTRAYVSAVELGKVRPAVKSLEFLAAKLGKPTSHFIDDRQQERERLREKSEIALATQFLSEGRLSDAIGLLEPLIKASQTSAERADLTRLLARAHTEGGDGVKAIPMLIDVLRHYQRAGNSEYALRTRAQLATALLASHSYAEAATHLEVGLSAYASGALRDPVLKVHILHNLGVTHQMRGDPATALKYYERAELEGADIGDPRWLASLFAATGMARHETGDFEAAISYLRKSQALFEAVRNKSRVAEIRFQIGVALWLQGNIRKGRDVLQEAELAARTSGNEQLAMRAAISAASCASDLDEEHAIQTLVTLHVRAKTEGKLAIRFLATYALGRALKKSDLLEAERLLRESVAIAEEMGIGGEQADAYRELSDVLARRGLATAALEYANKAFQSIRRSD